MVVPYNVILFFSQCWLAASLRKGFAGEVEAALVNSSSNGSTNGLLGAFEPIVATALATPNADADVTIAPVDDETMWKFTAVLAAITAFTLFCNCSSHTREKAAKMEEIETRNEFLQDAIHGLFDEMETNLSNITETTAQMAESIFEARRRDFLKFLKAAKDCPERFGSEEVMASFRCFVWRWLLVFQECSLDPIKKPMSLVEPQELSDCGDVRDIAALVVERLQKCKIESVSSLVQRLNQDCHKMEKQNTMKATRSSVSTESEEDCHGFGIQFHSASHLALFIMPLLGFGATSYSLHRHSTLHAVILGFVSLCSIVSFSMYDTGDDIARLENTLQEVKKEHDAAKKQSEKLEAMYRKAHTLATLWLYRTVPSLDILHEVHQSLWDVDGSEVVSYLEHAEYSFQKIALAFGPLSIWYGEDAFSEERLKMIATTQCNCIDKQMVKVVQDDPEMLARIGHWTQNDAATQCGQCNKTFSRFFRKHHCRRCGDIFCGYCSNHFEPVPKLGITLSVRVCGGCSKALEQEQEEEDALQLIMQKLPSMVKRVQALGFLTAIIHRASNFVTQKSGSFHGSFHDDDQHDLQEVVVRLRVGDKDWQYTERLEVEGNPHWNEEFFFPVRDRDRTLMVEMYCGGDCLASLDIDFRDLPSGEWLQTKQKLRNATSGELHFELRFAESAWQLV